MPCLKTNTIKPSTSVYLTRFNSNQELCILMSYAPYLLPLRLSLSQPKLSQLFNWIYYNDPLLQLPPPIHEITAQSTTSTTPTYNFSLSLFQPTTFAYSLASAYLPNRLFFISSTTSNYIYFDRQTTSTSSPLTITPNF